MDASDNQQGDTSSEREACPTDCGDNSAIENKMVLEERAPVSTEDVEEATADGLRFDPPLYVQRYAFVQNILQQHKIKSVVDFGSAECKIARWVKEVGTVEQIWLVDIDAAILRTSTVLIRPHTYDYLVRRPRPLTITMLQGSAADLDHRLIGCQAVTMVELIEHLEAQVLSAVTDNIFGQLHPSLIIITTPNAEFNPLFPGMSRFRHWDHKFEWTRQEFQDWCEGVCNKYGYTVKYAGIGDPPPDKSHVGHCSQAAIFTEAAGKPGLQEADLIYSQVSEAVYPVDERTTEQKLTSDVEYTLRQLAKLEEYHVNDCYSEKALVPFDRIFSQIACSCKQQWGVHQIREYLCKAYTVSDDGTCVVFPLPRLSSSDSSCASNSDDAGEDTAVNPGDRLEENIPADSELWVDEYGCSQFIDGLSSG